MSKIIKQHTIFSKSISEFDTLINDGLAKGWELYGNMIIVCGGDSMYKYQQMVYREQDRGEEIES